MSRALATNPFTDRQRLPAQLDPVLLPRHVAVIMDGNGRWARQRGLPRVMGHRAGVEALKRTLRLCGEWGIGALTAYAFSTENWNRPDEEVSFLMTLFERVLARELEALERQQVRIRFLGDLEPLPEGLRPTSLMPPSARPATPASISTSARTTAAAANWCGPPVCWRSGPPAGILDPVSIDEDDFRRGAVSPPATWIPIC